MNECYLILLPDLVQKIKDKCVEREFRYTVNKLEESLDDFIRETTLLSGEERKQYADKFKSISVDILKRALNGPQATKGIYLNSNRWLLELLCLYGFEKKWEEVMKDCGLVEIDLCVKRIGGIDYKLNELSDTANEIVAEKHEVKILEFSSPRHTNTQYQSGTTFALLEATKTKNKNSECLHISSEYWKTLAQKYIPWKDSIFRNFFLRADETLTQEVIAIEAYVSSQNTETFHQKIVEVRHKNGKNSRAEKIDDFIDSCFLLNCSVLIKVIAASGEGKTVFLNQIAFEYSHLPQKCKVYYVNNVSLEAINFLKSELEVATIPLLFLLDTPSKYADILNDNFSIVCEKNYKPFVMVVGDQEDRFSRKLIGNSWSPKFENYFSEVFQIDFELTQTVKQDIYQKIVNLLKRVEGLSDEKEVTIKGIYNSNLQLTTRELIYKITKYLERNFTTKHITDWDIWDQITQAEPVRKFRDLFPFVALFASFEIPVPVSIFDYGYLSQVTKENVEDFISLQSNNSIIKIKNNKLELRHEQIPLWYFEIPEHAGKKKRVLRKFICDFERELDSYGCYLFRNIHASIIEDKLLEDFTPLKGKELLTSYFSKVGFTDPDCPKVVTELAKLEVNYLDKINWLDKTIDANENDFHARTFKVQLLISAEEYDSAQIILDRLFEISETVTWTLGCQFELDLKSKKSYTAEKYIGLAQGKKDTNKALIELARRIQYVKPAIPIALDILTYLKGLEPLNPIAPMIIANIYSQRKSKDGNERAIAELTLILANNETYIPAILLLADVYAQSNEVEKAEKKLLEGITYKADQSALYVRLIKLYREKKYLVPNAVEKMGKILQQGLEEQSLGLKMQIRTEYAKWCYENFEDNFEKNKTAIDILIGTIKLYPSHIHSRVELGLIYQKSKFFKNLDASISILKECFNIKYSKYEVAFRVVLAETLMLLNTPSSWMEARGILENAVNIKPKNLPTYLGLVKVYQYFNDIQRLKNTINHIEYSANKYGSYYTSVAQQLLKAGKIDEALGILKEALSEDDKNFYFLNQAAKILLYYTSQENIIIGNDFSTIFQKRNTILFLAEEYLLRSLFEFRSNEYTLYLLIQVYDGLKYNTSYEATEYKNAIRLRNERIEELYRINKNNPYLINTLSQIFRTSWKPMLAIFILESCDIQNYNSEEKLKFLTQLKANHRLFNNTKKITEITNHFNEISKASNSPQKITETFNRVEFFERPNYKLVKLFNEGYIEPPFESVELNGDVIQVVPVGKKINNQIIKRQKVYFALYKVDDKIFANNIEPYFEKNMSQILLNNLPERLNCLEY